MTRLQSYLEELMALTDLIGQEHGSTSQANSSLAQELKNYKPVLKQFLRTTPLSLGKKLEYVTYTTSYGLASLVHYHAKRRRS